MCILWHICVHAPASLLHVAGYAAFPCCQHAFLIGTYASCQRNICVGFRVSFCSVKPELILECSVVVIPVHRRM